MNLEAQFPLLLDLLLKSAGVMLGAAGASLLFRRASAANRHALWQAAFFVALLLPVTEAAKPRWDYRWKQRAASVRPSGLPPIISRTELPSTAPRGIPTAPVPSLSNRLTTLDWRAAGMAIWLAGTGVILGRRMAMSWRLQRLGRRSKPVSDVQVLAMAQSLMPRDQARARLRVSPDCPVPIVFGVVRPLILLPVAALAWDQARIETALRHELAHVRRGDCLTRLLSDLACALYWMNPLIWAAARAMRLTQEQACDDLVLSSGADAADYASQLVDVVRSLGANGWAGRRALAMAQPSTLETRVRSIVDPARDRRPLSRGVATTATVAASAALILCGAARLSATAQETPPPPASAPPSTRVEPEAPTVEISSKFIEVPETPASEAALRIILSSARVAGGSWTLLNEGQSVSLLKALTQTAQADILSAPTVTTRSRQRAIVEVGRELTYPTGWQREGNAGAWKPSSTETKNVGITMRFDADVRADKTLALQLTAELVEPKGCLDVETKTEYRRGREEPLKSFSDRLEPNDLPAVPPGHRTLPIFLTRKLTAEVSLAPGQTIVLELGSGVEGAAQTTEANPAGLTIAPGQAIILEHGPGADGAASVTDAPSPARKDDPDQAKRRLFVFVTAKIAHPTIESFQASSSEARP